MSQIVQLLTAPSLAPGEDPGPDPDPGMAWRDNYGDYMPLASGFAGAIHVDPGDDLNAAATAAHAGEGLWAVVLAPGTYTGRVYGNPDVAFVGATGDPADVLWQADGGTGPTYSPINGTPAILGGIHFQLTAGTGSGQYAYHMSAGGLMIAEACIFESQSTSRNTAVGADAAPGARCYFIDCTLIEAMSGPESTGGYHATNLHGTTPGDPIRFAFIGCTANGQVGFDDNDTGDVDEFWWIGGPAPYYQGGSPDTVTYYLDTALVGGSGGGSTVTVVRTTDLPPMPHHGALTE